MTRRVAKYWPDGTINCLCLLERARHREESPDRKHGRRAEASQCFLVTDHVREEEQRRGSHQHEVRRGIVAHQKKRHDCHGQREVGARRELADSGADTWAQGGLCSPKPTNTHSEKNCHNDGAWLSQQRDSITYVPPSEVH